MAISRMQQIRQNYGLGSFVKKITKKVTKPFTKVASKIVPKEIAGIMRVAAPFLPPGYREAAYLLGTAKQTGRISPIDLALAAAPTFFDKTQMGQNIRSSVSNYTLPGMERSLGEIAVGSPGTGVKEVDLAYSPPGIAGSGQAQALTGNTFTAGKDATTGLFGSEGKMFNFGKGQGFSQFKDQTKLGNLLLGNDKGGFSKSKIAGIGMGVLSLIQSAKTPEEAGNAYANATGNSADYDEGYKMFSMLDTSAFNIPQQFQLPAANGGLMRTNYAMGSGDEPLPEDPTKPVNPFGPKPIGPFPSDMAEIPTNLNLEKAIRDFIEFNGREPRDMQELLDFFDVPAKTDAAGGGLMRSNYALGDMAMNQAPSMGMGMGMSSNLGSRPTNQESGLGGLPIEADMRYTGGFMPYGEVEKADDVPARLSKNEFVFTADAVRAAGGGSVQQGAKKMYDAMKKLEQQPEAKGAMA